MQRIRNEWCRTLALSAISPQSRIFLDSKDNPAKLVIQARAVRKGKFKRKGLGRILWPHMETLTYQAKLAKVPQEFNRLVVERLLPLLPRLLAGSSFGQVTDAKDEDLDDTLDGIAGAVEESLANDDWIEAQAQRHFQEVSAFQRKQLTEKLVRSISVNVWFKDPWYLEQVNSFVADNVSYIKGATLAQKQDIKRTVLEGVRSGRRVEDLAADVKARFPVSENRARMIARDQTATLFGNMNRLRQGEVGIKSYFWRTVGDERVRDTHEELEGQECDWDDPPVTNAQGDTNHPGEDWECRCTAEPILPGEED